MVFSHNTVKDWAQHGISGRGVLLDLVEYYTEGGTKPLPYNPWSSHGITVADLETVAVKQGVKFRPWDILVIRAGFMSHYNSSSVEERHELALSEKDHALSVSPSL